MNGKTSREEYHYEPDFGLFDGTRVNYFEPIEDPKDYYCLPNCILKKPNPPKGKIPQINSTFTDWNYVNDVAGIWYHTKTLQQIIRFPKDYAFDVSEYTRLIPLEFSPYCSWDGSKWAIDEKTKTDDLNNNSVKNQLSMIDFQSIRSLREWLAAQTNAPQFIKDYEDKAKELRGQLK
jgi:hypothetical protein